jgi:hypothetical protein
MTQGIDMDRSGWDNPDGFKPQERETVPVVEISACENAGPDGWVCDLPPGHRGDVHRAELGPTWPTKWALTSEPATLTLDNRDGGPDRSVLAEIRHLALGAMDSDKSSAWAVALASIVEMTRGY